MLYRYRTQALVGEWRTSAAQACEDAVRARQADREHDGGVKWRAGARLDLSAAQPGGAGSGLRSA